ncbi:MULTISPECIES: aminotransferase-like domain-containing protein [Chitinophagaceae]
MSGSPVSILLSHLLIVKRGDAKAVYLQLAEQITHAVRGKILQPGTALPGTRQLAEALHLHRKTIVAAYEELALQGIVTLVPNKGTYINRDIIFNALPMKEEEASCVVPNITRLPLPNNRVLETERVQANDWMLDGGIPDVRLFSHEKLGVGLSGLLAKNYTRSSYFVPYILGMYIGETNNIAVPEKQVLVTANTSMSLALITQGLLRKGDVVVVGAPGNYKANMPIQQANAVLKTIAVESDGLDVLALEDLCKKHPVKMLYVNADHHFPTTTVLSYAKRLELLRLAHQYRFFILEDETYSLYDFRKKQLPSLLSLDTEGVVVYVHSFEQVLRADWSIGYIVAPQNVLAELQKYMVYLGLDYSSIAQGLVASALQSGGLQRLLKKNTRIYQVRRNSFCESVHRYWGEYVQLDIPKNGLGVWLHFDWSTNLAAFAKKLAIEGVVVPNYLLFQSRKWTAMRLGFGRWNEDEMDTIVERGKRCF